MPEAHERTANGCGTTHRLSERLGGCCRHRCCHRLTRHRTRRLHAGRFIEKDCRRECVHRVNVGPKRSAGASDTSRPKPLSKIGDNVDKVAARANAAVTSAARNVTASVAVSKPSIKPVAKPQPKPTPSPEEFEAQQVERLKNLYQPKQAATTPLPKAATTITSTAALLPDRRSQPVPG